VLYRHNGHRLSVDDYTIALTILREQVAKIQTKPGDSVGIWSLRSGFNPHTESCFGLIWAHFVMRSAVANWQRRCSRVGCHRVMRSPGRTSIKVVLPAIWKHQDHIRNHPWFAEYHLEKGTQGWDDPYKALPALPIGTPENETEEDLVADGTGAIRVYQELLFAGHLTEGVEMNHKQLLLQYCKLDTAAMVMIWRHWVNDHN
jgi:hypothetical protein